MKGLVTISFRGITLIVFLLFVISCGTVAKTKPDVGLYKGQPLVYPYPIADVKETCKEVLAEQNYTIVSEDLKKIRAIRYKTSWRPKGSDMTITFTELQPNSTRIDIVSQTDFEFLTFGLQDIYVEDFLKSLRKRLLGKKELFEEIKRLRENNKGRYRKCLVLKN